MGSYCILGVGLEALTHSAGSTRKNFKKYCSAQIEMSGT
jgi:hypothetical protein